MELLVIYKCGEITFSTIDSCYQCFPQQTEEYLLKNNWMQLTSKSNKWRKLGYRTDPKSKRNLGIHSLDEFSTESWVLKAIEKWKKNQANKKK